jgi:hypothetical protein
MVFLFQRYRVPCCCLCGKKGLLTGEHKIKAAMLKQEFGKAQLSVHRTDGSEEKWRIAQSIKSKHLKFNSRICQTCNSDRTQLPDREFDKFSKLALQKLRLQQDPKSLLDNEIYQVGSSSYLNLFRYFAKLLCCHLAEIDAPIPRRLSRFAISKSQHNYVWLDVQRDWAYEQAEAQFGKFQYAAHGGLLVYGDSSTNAPTGFHSTVTFGPLQYIFSMHLAPVEILELKHIYHEFYDWCCSHVEIAKQVPLSSEQKRRIGLF